MTTQQLAHRFCTALNCPIDRATGELSPLVSSFVLSPCYFSLGAALLLPVINPDDRFWRSPWPQQPGQALHSHHSGQRGTIQSP
jgi:hypothetical protein